MAAAIDVFELGLCRYFDLLTGMCKNFSVPVYVLCILEKLPEEVGINFEAKPLNPQRSM